MKEGIYKVKVSSLEVRKDPKIASKVSLKRDTVVELTGQQKQYRKEYWVEMSVLTDPNIKGYVQLKYLSKIH